MLKLYFGGAENPGWKKLLIKEGVEHVALSYVGLRKRAYKRAWRIAEEFPAGQKVFLDSGAYTLNKDPDAYTAEELEQLAWEYVDFVKENLDAVEMVSELDVKRFGRQWAQAMRVSFWDTLPAGKFLPVWHAEYGLDELQRLAERYQRVALAQTDLNGRDLAPILNRLAADGVKLHGIAMTKPAAMADVRWDSVASTSWLSPGQYGDTIVWTGKELKRYPRKYKDESRKRHRTLFTSAGLDAEKIAADDRIEVTRLSIWSWQQLAASLTRHSSNGEIVNMWPKSADRDNAETDGSPVDTPGGEKRNSPGRRERARTTLPVLGVETRTDTYLDELGNQQERQVPLLKARSESLRACDSCFLANKCPGFEPGSNCLYDIPIEIRTKDQLRALQDSMIEMQTQRVLFMRMSEDVEGGYADPNLSGEMDRLTKMIAARQDADSGFSLKIEAKQHGDGGGIMSRIFGPSAGEQMRALPAPVPADDAMVQLGIVDAEVINEY